VHVVIYRVICAGWNTCVSQPLDVITLVLAAFIIRDDSDFDSSFVSLDHSVSKDVIGQVENTDYEGSSCLFDVAFQLVHVVFVREEECFQVTRFWAVQIDLYLVNQLAKALQNLLIVIIFYLFRCFTK
jgi:hypothetical protein